MLPQDAADSPAWGGRLLHVAGAVPAVARPARTAQAAEEAPLDVDAGAALEWQHTHPTAALPALVFSQAVPASEAVLRQDALPAGEREEIGKPVVAGNQVPARQPLSDTPASGAGRVMSTPPRTLQLPFQDGYFYPVGVRVHVAEDGNCVPPPGSGSTGRAHFADVGNILGQADGVGLHARQEECSYSGWASSAWVMLDFGGVFESDWQLQVRTKLPSGDYNAVKQVGEGLGWSYGTHYEHYNTGDWDWCAVGDGQCPGSYAGQYYWNCLVPPQGSYEDTTAARTISVTFWFNKSPNYETWGYFDTVRVTGTMAYDPQPHEQYLSPSDCPFGTNRGSQHWVGDSINTRTGNFHHSQEDLSLAAAGGPIALRRSYSSQATDLYTGTLGAGLDAQLPGQPELRRWE